MLLSHSLTGSLIGAGGKSIKEIQAVTGAKVHVSNSTEPYPGTSDRVVVIMGDIDNVSLTQTLIWELIGLVTSAENPRDVDWSPQAMVGFLGQNDAVEVVGKITIPAAAGGLMLGRGGEHIRSLASESGAKVHMTGKDEALLTQERVMTISGGVGRCIKCTAMILQRLDESEEAIPYANRGSGYAPANNPFRLPMGATGSSTGKRSYPGSGDGRDRGGDREEAPVAETVITLAVPDEHMGNIFGRQGATLREIISLSGAKVTVSGRGEFVEGTTNRVITITGSPTAAQTAHMFVTQRLQTPANPNGTRRTSSDIL